MLDLLGALPGAVAQGLVWGLCAIGVYVTFRVLGIADLTVDGSFCTGAAVTAAMMIAGVPLPVCLLCAFASGLFAGCVTGLLHVVLGIPDILAGILTQLALWSVNLKIMSGANLSLPARSFRVLITQLNKPIAILVMAIFTAVLVGLLYLFFGTEIGCALRATGCNGQMSRAQGINTNVMKVLGLSLSNAIVALSGAMLCQYQGYSDINMGKGAIVVALAAVVIGEAVFSRISRNFAAKLLGVSAGAVIYYLVYQIIIFTGFDTDLLKMLSALVVAGFLGVPYLRTHYFPKRKAGDGNRA